MKKHLPILSLALAISLCFSCKQEINVEVSKASETAELKEANSSSGPESITRNILQDRAGNIWLAAFDGVFRYDGDSFTLMTNEVSSSRFFSLLEDSQGNLWFGTIGEGVFRYDGESFENFNKIIGIVENEIVSIYEDRSGAIWFGGNGGLSRYDEGAIQKFILTPDSLYADPGLRPRLNLGKDVSPSREVMEVNAILEDKTGMLWFATRGYTYQYDGSTFTPLLHDGQPFANNRHLIQDQSGNIWLSGQDGLWRYNGEKFTQLAANFTGFIYEDRKGNIWTGSESEDRTWALSRWDQEFLSAESPISIVIKGNEGMIFGILEAENGEIWYGTLKGPQRFDSESFPGL